MGKFKMAALMAGEWVNLFIDFRFLLIEIWLKLQGERNWVNISTFPSYNLQHLFQTTAEETRKESKPPVLL